MFCFHLTLLNHLFGVQEHFQCKELTRKVSNEGNVWSYVVCVRACVRASDTQPTVKRFEGDKKVLAATLVQRDFGLLLSGLLWQFHAARKRKKKNHCSNSVILSGHIQINLYWVASLQAFTCSLWYHEPNGGMCVGLKVSVSTMHYKLNTWLIDMASC